MLANKTVIQIGSHIGNTNNDPVYKHIASSTRLILVEPVQHLFTKLVMNYRAKLDNDCSNIVFINKAVSDHCGLIEMTIPSPRNDFSRLPSWATQISSVDASHCISHIPNIQVDKIIVEATTVDEIVYLNKIDDIYLLHIDTEGHDYVILDSYSFRVKPKIVIFEHKHMDGFMRTSTLYEKLCKKLEGLGYKKVSMGAEDTVFRLG